RHPHRVQEHPSRPAVNYPQHPYAPSELLLRARITSVACPCTHGRVLLRFELREACIPAHPLWWQACPVLKREPGGEGVGSHGGEFGIWQREFYEAGFRFRPKRCIRMPACQIVQGFPNGVAIAPHFSEFFPV